MMSYAATSYCTVGLVIIIIIIMFIQCFQLSDIINLVWACRKELSHQTL